MTWRQHPGCTARASHGRSAPCDGASWSRPPIREACLLVSCDVDHGLACPPCVRRVSSALGAGPGGWVPDVAGPRPAGSARAPGPQDPRSAHPHRREAVDSDGERASSTGGVATTGRDGHDPPPGPAGVLHSMPNTCSPRTRSTRRRAGRLHERGRRPRSHRGRALTRDRAGSTR